MRTQQICNAVNVYGRECGGRDGQCDDCRSVDSGHAFGVSLAVDALYLGRRIEITLSDVEYWAGELSDPCCVSRELAWSAWADAFARHVKALAKAASL